MGLSILLWACIIYLPMLMYFMLRNDAKFKKNIAVGVTIPAEGREDAEVIAALNKFKKELLWVCLGLTIVPIPCIFIESFGVQFTIWLIWVDFMVALSMLPYVRCNKKLKKIKEERGWNRSPGCVAELKVAAMPVKWMSPWLFVIPAVISVIPVIFDFDLWFVYVIDGVFVVLCWFSYRYLYRNKSEVIDDDVSVTEALTRIRRYNWGKCWLWCAWFLAVLNVLMWLLQDNVWFVLAAVLITTVLVCVVLINVEFKTRRLQEKLTADSGREFYVDDDDKWLWGMFYYDRNDSHLIVNNRIGINSTFNLAKPAGKVIMGLVVVLLLAMPLIGVYTIYMEACPVTLTVTEESILAEHAGTCYTVDLDEVSEVKLLEEAFDISRVAGTGMPNVQKGKYKSDYGSITVCIDPRTGPYLLVELEDGSLYLLGSSDGEEVKTVYNNFFE